MRLLSLIFCVCLLGCESNPTHPTSSAEPGTGDGAVLTTLALGTPLDATLPTPATRPAAETLAHQHQQTYWALAERVHRAPDWQTAHASVQAFLAAPPEDRTSVPAFVREQFAANVMLRSALLDGPGTPERLETLSHYVEIMHTYHNPEAALIGPALDQLAGYWPAARWEATAATFAEAAEAYVAEKRTHYLAKLEKMGKRPGDDDDIDAMLTYLDATAATATTLRLQ